MIVQCNSIRQHGHIKQQQQGFAAVRIRTIAGNMTSDQLRKVADLSDKYGQGQLHITTRQSVEIHWVQENQLETIFQEIQDFDLLLAVRGPRIMTVIACPGITLCKRGIGDTVMLANQLNDCMVGREMSGKTKIAVSGCPSSCAKPQINDIGLHSVMIPAVAEDVLRVIPVLRIVKLKRLRFGNWYPVLIETNVLGAGYVSRIVPSRL